MDGFQSALANLERTVMILEAICHHQRWCAAEEADEARNSQLFQFKLP
jgi:hypothetical protein